MHDFHFDKASQQVQAVCMCSYITVFVLPSSKYLNCLYCTAQEFVYPNSLLTCWVQGYFTQLKQDNACLIYIYTVACATCTDQLVYTCALLEIWMDTREVAFALPMWESVLSGAYAFSCPKRALPSIRHIQPCKGHHGSLAH